MPKTVQSALFLLVLTLVVIFARPGFGLNSVPASPSSEAVSPAENLDPRFWLADTLDLQAELNAHQVALSEWIESINRSNLEFLCLGEIHNQAFRQFLAQDIFSQLDVDVLMLEADPPQVEQFLSQVEAGIPSISLFGADIAAVIRAVQARNPDVQVLGVDETAQQTAWKNLEEVHAERQRLSRDGFIAQNIRQQFRPGSRHVALFGGSHCSLYDVGLGNSRPFFLHLAGVLTAREQMKSALIISAKQTNLFALTMRKAGLDNQLLAFPDTKAIAPTAYNFRWDLKSFWDNYDVMIHFPTP
ncbi:hypothetical protein H6F93_12430 [Leptolyngbya sp. FACHB-671]|uniref:hypothetical protein n=1 Tax=Leptolyngbya sp. FACHB-671 TaxID=2692812 RepID=UPI0016867D91|nr:hypothetical protein [Leptolyngbya sp. FACHB-671]MBD2068318.1 hypothetical protein [Leptolyngbya sp. FACHB-671]